MDPIRDSPAMADAASSSDEVLDELIAITGLERAMGATLLEACGGSLSDAVQLHFEQQEAPGNGPAMAHHMEEDATIAAAMAAQIDEDDAAQHDGAVDEDYDEPVDSPALRRASASPVIGAPGGSGRGRPGDQPSRLMRLYAFFGWLTTIPGVSHLHALIRASVQLAYRVGIVGFVGSLLWAPLAMFGLVPTPARMQAADVTAQAFEEWFEREHGTTHPGFFRGSCYGALSHAKAESKFVLVYLHEARSAECERFCETVLASALFTAVVDENFVLWVRPSHASASRPQSGPPGLRRVGSGLGNPPFLLLPCI